jgi:queuine tRNA-ribosyltransferase
LEFKLLKKDKQSSARLGYITTARGDIQTPIFMPVATHGAMKPLTPAQTAESWWSPQVHGMEQTGFN